MSVTPRQVELVQNTWNFVLLNTQDAGGIFYDRLFTIDPALRALFKSDTKVQSALLIGMISFAVKKLNSIGDIVSDVKALGARHKNYNVRAEDYATVATALLWTLEKALGSDWNEETKDAWVAVYTLLATTMQAGAAEA